MMQPYGRLRTVLIRDTSKGHEKEGEDNEEKIIYYYSTSCCLHAGRRVQQLRGNYCLWFRHGERKRAVERRQSAERRYRRA